MTTSKPESKQGARKQKVSQQDTRTAPTVKTGLRMGVAYEGYQPEY